MGTILRRTLVGALLGAAAIIPMNVAFGLAHRVGAIGTLPPRKVVAAVSPHLTEQRQGQVATIAHFLVGAAAGSAYVVVARRGTAGLASGILFGLLVWVLGYEVVMPAAADMPRAHRDRRPRAIAILAAHVVFGASLGRLARRSK